MLDWIKAGLGWQLGKALAGLLPFALVLGILALGLGCEAIGGRLRRRRREQGDDAVAE